MRKRIDKRDLIRERLDSLEDRIWQLLGIPSSSSVWLEALPALISIRKELKLMRKKLVRVSRIEPKLFIEEPLIHSAGSSPLRLVRDKQQKQEPAFHSLPDTLLQGR